MTLTVNPDSSIPSGEENDVEIVLKSGLQTMILTGNFMVSGSKLFI
ncbi:MAG: hypothetical protein R2883_04495 [Caldisericia bacterium]